MFKVTLLNGPKLSGKDTLADLVSDREGYQKREFKHRLYEIGSTLAGMDIYSYVSMCTDRDRKEEPSELLGGKSPREHLIWASEVVTKPLFGHNHFGNYLSNDLLNDMGRGLKGSVVSDSGFEEELEAIIMAFENEYEDNYNIFEEIEIHVVRLHKAGRTFAGDSRDYLKTEIHYSGIVSYHDLTVVDGDIEGTYEALRASVGGF